MFETLCRINHVSSPDKLNLIIPNSSFYNAENYFKKESGKVLIAHFKRRMRPRTTGAKSQNHAINGGVTQLSIETGHTFDEIKIIMKNRAIRRGYPIKKDLEGNPLISPFTGDPLPESETQIDRVQAGFLIDEIIQTAAELGIILRGFCYD